jgi:hypothetical protein
MPAETAVRLSCAQKRDLLGMSAAAMVTTMVIAAPWLIPSEPAAPMLVDPAVLSVSAVPAPAMIASINEGTFDRGAVPASTVAKKRRERTAILSSPARLASTPMLTTNAPVVVAAAAVTMPPSNAKPLGKRIAGLFTGDGTYTVRPFPSIPAERQ